uniref:Uncharacterized protein n=1 Tax=Romanomermis culicivorax TaxID=13658 RepID=A0A915JZU7_ROMCU
MHALPQPFERIYHYKKLSSSKVMIRRFLSQKFNGGARNARTAFFQIYYSEFNGASSIAIQRCKIKKQQKTTGNGLVFGQKYPTE